MGGDIINFGNTEALVEKQLSAVLDQNQEMRNSNQLRIKELMSGQEMMNGLSGIIAAASSQYNITSFNPLFQANIAACISINFSFLNYFYKTHGIIQTAIDQPVLDALSSGDQSGGGVDVKARNLDEYSHDELMAFMEDEGIWNEVIGQSKIWARLFGGGAIIVNDGAADMSQPMDDREPIRFLKLYAASRWELGSPNKLSTPGDVVTNDDPAHTAMASQEIYNYYGMRLHKSRVITLGGKEAPWQVRWQLQGWGMSEVERMVEDFNLYIKQRNVIYDLLNEAKVDVFSIDGFRELLGTDGGDQQVIRRVRTVQQAKNMNNALLLDKNDEYSQKQISFAGFADMMREIRMGIASSVRMPISKIFGVAATGFSSGEDDLETYNAMVQSQVRQGLRKPIRRVLDLVMRYKWGAPIEQYTIHFKPLRVMSAKDEEEIKDKKFKRGMEMVQGQMMTSKEMGELCHKENLISVETAAQKGLTEDFPVVEQQEESADADTERQKDLQKSKPKASKEK